MGGLKTSPLPPTGYAESQLPPEFGRVVEGFEPKDASTDDYAEVERLLYEHSVLIFRGAKSRRPVDRVVAEVLGFPRYDQTSTSTRRHSLSLPNGLTRQPSRMATAMGLQESRLKAYS